MRNNSGISKLTTQFLAEYGYELIVGTILENGFFLFYPTTPSVVIVDESVAFPEDFFASNQTKVILITSEPGNERNLSSELLEVYTEIIDTSNFSRLTDVLKNNL